MKNCIFQRLNQWYDFDPLRFNARNNKILVYQYTQKTGTATFSFGLSCKIFMLRVLFIHLKTSRVMRMKLNVSETITRHSRSYIVTRSSINTHLSLNCCPTYAWIHYNYTSVVLITFTNIRVHLRSYG